MIPLVRDPRVITRMRALAACALALALGLSYGQFGEGALALVLLAIAALAVCAPASTERTASATSAEAHASDEAGGEADARRILGLGLGLGLGFALLSPPGVVVDPSRLDAYPWLVLASAALAASYAKRELGARVRTLRFALLVALFVASALVVLQASPAPPIDVFQLQQHAGLRLLEGLDPFTGETPNPYGPGSPLLAPEVLSADGRRILGFPYPPLSLALVAPFATLGDVRYAHLLATVLCAVAIRALGRARPTAELAAAFLLLAPRTFFVLEVSWTEPLLLLASLGIALAIARRTPGGLETASESSSGDRIRLALGFAALLALKQTAPLLALPLLGPLPMRARRRIALGAAGLALLTLLPFLAHDPGALVRGLVDFHLHQPFRADALTLPALVHAHGGPSLPSWPSFVLAGAVAVALAVLLRARTLADALAGAALGFALFVVTNKQAGANYYWLVVGLLLASLAAAAEGGQDTGVTRDRDDRARPIERSAGVWLPTLGASLLLALVLLVPRGASATAVFTLSHSLPHRAFELPEGAPSVVVHGGPSFAPGVPFDLVIFLHGYSGCVNVLARSGRVRCTPTSPVETGWGLAAAHDRANQNTLLLMPQLAYRQRNGDPGRFRQDGFARDMVREAFRASRAQLGGAGLDRVRRIVLVVHSGGYDAATAILDHGRLGPRVKRVVLFDALYGGTSQFLEWVRGAPDRTLVSIYNAGRPAEQTRILVAGARRHELRVSEDPSSLRTAIRRNRVTAFHTRVAHGDIPARYFRDVLQF